MKTKDKLITSLKIWIVIYPSVTLLLYLLADIIGERPLFIRTLFLTILLVPWMVFVGTPLLNAIINLFSTKSK